MVNHLVFTSYHDIEFLELISKMVGCGAWLDRRRRAASAQSQDADDGQAEHPRSWD
jgi:hypothetical protein